MTPERFIIEGCDTTEQEVTYDLTDQQKECLEDISNDLSDLKKNTQPFIYKHVRGAFEKIFSNTTTNATIEAMYTQIQADHPDLKMNIYKGKKMPREDLYIGIRGTRVLQALLQLKGYDVEIDGFLGEKTLFYAQKAGIDFTKVEESGYIVKFLEQLNGGTPPPTTIEDPEEEPQEVLLDDTSGMPTSASLKERIESYDSSKGGGSNPTDYKGMLQKELGKYDLDGRGYRTEKNTRIEFSKEIRKLFYKHGIGPTNRGVKELLQSLCHENDDINYGTKDTTEQKEKNKKVLTEAEARIKTKADERKSFSEFEQIYNHPIGKYGSTGEFSVMDCSDGVSEFKIYDNTGEETKIHLPSTATDLGDSSYTFTIGGKVIAMKIEDGILEFRSATAGTNLKINFDNTGEGTIGSV